MLVSALALAVACSSGDARASGRPPSDLPLGHWAYPLLERLASRGFIELDLTTLPVSRSDAERAITECLGTVMSPVESLGPDGRPLPEGVTEREAWALRLLARELERGEVDEPALTVRSGDASGSLGLRLGTEFVHESGEDVDGSIDVAYEMWGGADRGLGLYSDATILFEGQDGPRVETLSSRARTWRGVAFYADRAYLKFEREHVQVALGRRDAAWGRSPDGRLLLSGTAPTLDCLDARFRVGPLSFEALNAFLERTEVEGLGEADTLAFPEGQAFLAAHRLVVSGGWGSVGVAEAVVYSGDTPDPSYANPLLPYYVSQHNERANDNVLWSLDFLARPATGLDVWGEFLVDDLQYDRNTGAPDKYGVTLGAQYFGESPAGDYELTCEYTNVRKWTYTHHVSGHRFTQDGVPLGFELGPDADRTTIALAFHPRPRWSLRSVYAFERKGEGSIAVPFVKGEDDEPAFPSGDVRRTHRAGMTFAYDDPGRLSLEVGGALAWARDQGGSDDSHEIWGRVSFRI